MKQTIYILAFLAILSACNKRSKNKDNQLLPGTANTNQQEKPFEVSQETDRTKDTLGCDFVYDTITNEKYKMHLRILDKCKNKEKRGYFYNANGDTLNNFLHHQDIAAFTLRLDSTEKGIYKRLTNRVVFLILEQDPKMLDYGLTQWTRDNKQLDYFMWHVSNPACNTIPIDSIISIIDRDMGEPNQSAKKVKKMLLKQLKISKK